MATVTATLAPGAGYANVTLTSWAGDANFVTAPVAGGQIEGSDALTLNADGTVSGADGSYPLLYIAPDGQFEGITYTIGTSDVIDPIIDTLTATGTDPDSIAVSFNSNEDNGTSYFFATAAATTETASAIKAGAQGSQAVTATGAQSLTLTLATGTWYIHALHEDAAGNPSNILVSDAVTLAEIVESATTTAVFSGGADYTTATLGAGFDASTSAFQQWTGGEPAATWQITTLTAEGWFDEDGQYWKPAGVADGIQDVWVIRPDGTVTVEQFDNTGLATLPDENIVIDSFESTRSTITVNFSYAGVDAAGYEYSVDAGAWASTTSPLTLTGLIADTQYEVRIRPVSIEGVPGLSATRLIRTAAAIDTTPSAFAFTALTNVARNVPQTSNAITVQSVDTGVDVPVSVTGGEYSVSTDNGTTWSNWTETAGNVRLNHRVRARHTSSNEYSSGGYDGVRETTLTVGGVPAVFRSTTLADLIKPVITLTGGNVTVVQGDAWVEPGYEAIDNADGDISVSGVQVSTDPDTSTLGTKTVTYTATDLSGNVATATRIVTVVEAVPDDTIKPVITLTGGNQTVTQGNAWAEPGFSATDNVDGDLTSQVAVTGSVNTATPGSYPLTYSVTDTAGNTGTATRTVTVLSAVTYPFDVNAPVKRTIVANRYVTFQSSEELKLMQSGEVLDYDFDLTDWLALEGDQIAQGTHEYSELADSLTVMDSGIVTGTSRLKVWLSAGAVKDSESSLVQLKVTTTNYRTAVFQFRVLVINRMQ